MPAADSYIDVEAARLRVRDEGSGPAVLLLHGWALDLDMWEPQVAELAARYRMIRFDRRGFGLSTGRPSLESDVADVWMLLDRLRVQDTMLVGMSQGARVALRAALARPARVAAVVLDGAPDEMAPEAADIPLDDYRELAARDGVAAVRRMWSRHPLMQLAGSNARTREHLNRILERYSGSDLLEPAPPLPSLAARLGSLRASAMIVNGARDIESRREAGQRLCQAIPGARHTLVPDAGHLPNLDNPSFYNAVLSRFFKETLDARA